MGKRQKNRRRHPRVKLRLLVQLRARDMEELVREYSSDISAGGMFIRTERPRPEGSMLYFQLTTEERGPVIEGLGRVVRVVEKGGDLVPGMGIEFVNIEEGSRAVIQKIVESRLEVSHDA